jgi:hypothetical protein
MNAITLAAVLFAATSQPATNIADLRTRKSELEKQVAAATAELRTVNAAIAKLGKAETFPIDHREEAKSKLTAVQYEQVKAIKFGGVGAVNAPGLNWVWVQVGKGPLPPGLTVQWRMIYRDGDAPWTIWTSGVRSMATTAEGHAGAASINRPVTNAYALVSLGDTPIYESVWKIEKSPVAPNGIAWFRDDSLLNRPTP